MVAHSSNDIEDDLRHILQRVHNFMVKDIEAGDDLLWTDEYGDLYRDVSDVLASQLETRASLTTASGEAAEIERVRAASPFECYRDPQRAAETISALVKALLLARARIEYLGAACNDLRHFEANSATFLPEIDEVLGAVGTVALWEQWGEP
jgi:hypothetical protein